ncbi:HDOD domain-containing protein [Oxalobacteraceae bacterium]|nr:HDOD domain-containing protein [Oxalobacteraceae bacterium]
MLAIDDVIKSIHALPSLPAVVAELLASVEQEDIDMHALAAKLALDQGLSAKTLRLANSSFYGMPAKVTSIQQAIAVLGIHSIRTLVTACSVTAGFPPGGNSEFDFEAFWRHAIGTAVCARLLAPRLRQSPETAFTAALLHDLGTLVLATRFPDDYRQVEAWRIEHDSSTSAAQQAVFGLDHAGVGSALAAYWKFPLAIQEAVASHHCDPPPDHGLGLTIYLANVLAHALDLSGRDDEQVPPLAPQAWGQLGLDDQGCLQLFAEAETMFHEMCQVLVN